MSKVFRTVYTVYDRVIAVSKAVCQDLTSRSGFMVPSEKVKVIPNCLDYQKLDEHVRGLSLPSRLELKPHAPVVSTIANFVPIKGHRWLISAIPAVVKHIPDVTFILYGSGDGKTAAQRWVEDAGVGANVIFLDPSTVSALEVLALSDVVVVPSLSEGFGMVVLEACALAKPVVATAVGGIPEILEDRRTGLLVPPGNTEALASAILLVLRDPSFGRRLGEAGRQHVRSEFSIERMLGDTEALYACAAASKSGR
jgi:glycosyltransferase involved in cell wall biosynthesis